MKLFTVGDSISQGFRSLAAARTDQCYSTLLAQALGASPYRYPSWPAGGLPADLERLWRALEARYGNNIRGLEWLTVLQTLNIPLDEAETYYERGGGRADVPDPAGHPFWHNVACWGATVADAWQLTPRVCKARIAAACDREDGFLGAPSEAFYRTALRVLNPQLDPALDDVSQVGWLTRHARGEGIENVVLWLGANNALGTVLRLEINQTPNDPGQRPHTLSYDEREAHHWNLWHPDDFHAEYGALMKRVEAAMAENAAPDWRVFVGTVPLVTIAPLAKGVGPTTEVDGDVYFKYYTYFPFDEAFARTTPYQLTIQEALHIDRTIRRYNRSINELVAAANQRLAQAGRPGCYVVVDTCQSLHDIAWKRNDGKPTYQWPAHFEFLYPKVDTKYYHADTGGRLRQGGLFSLDGVHPTAIGHGLIAWDFLKALDKEGRAVNADQALDWPAIIASDSLYSRPIRMMGELYEHGDLARHAVRLLSLWRS
jgi:hypothetical protein